ncbi:GRIP and coiled-coil domain-containing protein 1 [Bombina bombina]|uniref:GRIP and coiled-coil domain-containing protein 1 n=1 Tax=Bombina bombina TaxID=8345 RepID=UPI00235AD214|nr:GRIP and coiled-coil domain-containing protein 1 [Bombina bombina]XP_053572293.1 GRIP and coiled-coil domain-containing protein 1 [Bombina bombina]XP_053572294.1 GRIP and coiled-coil domain-containing protein 1 [Bombina bombina]XP_053572295.1 GRIP and coiled-coil domain-containing protein 1 [Bombina bombina]
MEKLGMNFGGGPSKKELQDTVEAQRKQLQQYQTRLKDVVRAYKSLLKEKEALEASLHVLSAADEPHASPPEAEEPHDDQHSTHSEDSVETAGSLPSARGGETSEDERADPALRRGGGGAEEASGSESGVSTASGEGGPFAPGETDRRMVQLKNQLATLTSALATVTQEKSRMEASYQADKRKAKQELDALLQSMDEERSTMQAELQSLQEQLSETKARLISQQHDREQEQTDHAVMLRELQRLLQGERDQRQETELRLEEARQELAGRSELVGRAGAAEEQSKRLRKELEELRKEAQEVRKQKEEPDPEVQELRDQLSRVKEEMEKNLQEERRKKLEEEHQAQQRFLLEEQRLRSLESQVSEMSALLGAAETSKQRDQLIIRKFRDRLTQLETENKTLAMAASLHSPPEVVPSQAAPDSGVEGVEPHASALHYQQELQQLKEEYERYKARAQGVLRTKGTREGELEAGKKQMAELKEKYVTLRLLTEEAESKHRAEMEAVRKELYLLTQTHRQELEAVRKESRETIARMEDESRQHRERVLAVLAEKELELERLREAKIPTVVPLPDPLGNGLELPQSDSPAFLVYVEQLSRKEAEIGGLRRRKHELEAELQKAQERLVEQREEVQSLQQQVEKALRDRSREGANMEYLKNVLLGYLTLPDPCGRQHTLSALLTVLHFSPEERSAALHAQDGAKWWTGGKR